MKTLIHNQFCKYNYDLNFGDKFLFNNLYHTMHGTILYIYDKNMDCILRFHDYKGILVNHFKENGYYNIGVFLPFMPCKSNFKWKEMVNED